MVRSHPEFRSNVPYPPSLTRYLHEVCKVPAEIGLLQQMLEGHDYSALRAIRAIFGEDVPRVIQGVRL